MIQEAYRLAVRYMTPVIFLSDGYIANGAEPWLIPDPAKLPRFDVDYLSEPNNDDGGFLPYKRDARLVRPWVKPGTPGLEHRIGGLEKQDVTGNISYDAHNHQHMVNTRAAKIAGIADDIPLLAAHFAAAAARKHGPPGARSGSSSMPSRPTRRLSVWRARPRKASTTSSSRPSR